MKPIESTDSDLLQLIVSGDREAFAELYRRRQSNVYRFALHMSGAREVAEDITHEVFMVLMRKAGNYDEQRGSVNAFLLGIARNHLLRRLKRERLLLPIDESCAEFARALSRGCGSVRIAGDELCRSRGGPGMRRRYGSIETASRPHNADSTITTDSLGEFGERKT